LTNTDQKNLVDELGVIKPLSALSFDDDSLTFVSLPQSYFEPADLMSDKVQKSPGRTKVKSDFNSRVGDSNHSSIPDVAAMLPISLDDSGSGFHDDADDIERSMLQSRIASDAIIYSSSDGEKRSFILVDHNEELKICDQEEFIRKLGVTSSTSVKVLSIFGNTGDGKSYTLNHTLFGGQEVFKTSQLQSSCTAGVWAAYDPVNHAIVLDTEGLLGVSSNENKRTRLLLKVMAVSDMIIYRTRAERLHSDLFQFLGNASVAFRRHFSSELRAAAQRFQSDDIDVSSLCPAVVIFHETQHTEPLPEGTAEEEIRRRFQSLHLSIDGFGSLKYVGTQTLKPPTSFNSLLSVLESRLRDQSLRSARRPALVYQTLKVLNDKFSGEIEKEIPSMFPDQYFTCRVQCLSCSARCQMTLNHLRDKVEHSAGSDRRCRHQDQFDNCFYLCKACLRNGQEVTVMPKTYTSRENTWLGLASYAWSGYVLECVNCGVIYRSRQHWYGNVEPERTGVVQTRIRHVWPDGNPVLQGTHNAARRVLDGLTYVSDTITDYSKKPTKMVTNWVTDRIAPPYWVSNAEITNCAKCELQFDEKLQIHHCRACGRGFCDSCSSHRRPVPERNWGPEAVRVCDECFEPSSTKALTDSDGSGTVDPSELVPRRVGEAIGSTVGTLATIVNYPLVALRDAARPTYWLPDEEIKDCCVCSALFGPLLKLHHCRACGKGVCGACSARSRPVPSRGWDHPVRVCKTCFTLPDL